MPHFKGLETAALKNTSHLQAWTKLNVLHSMGHDEDLVYVYAKNHSQETVLNLGKLAPPNHRMSFLAILIS